MIPKKLTIEGLYSYRGRQSIDFENLVEAQLFGIFGSVGSGKSSILEAITYALYEKTERLNLRGDSRNYNMMNLKSDQLYIEFIFQAGKENKEYRFSVKGRRNSKQFEDVGSYERSAYVKNGGEWEPLENPDAEEILGLNYDNFKRTIIIPQGNFQEFLQLGNKDRTQMLKEIFQLNKFDLGPKVNSLIKKNDIEKSKIEGALGQIEEVDEELIKQNEEELEEIKKEVEAHIKKLDKKQKEKSTLDQLKRLYDQLNGQKEALLQLKSRGTLFEQREMKLRNFEYCHLHFNALLERKQEKMKDVEESKKQIEELEKEIKGYENNLNEKSRAFAEVEKDYKMLDKYKRQQEEFQKLIDIKALQKEFKSLSERIEKGKPLIVELEAQLAKYNEEKSRLNKEIKGKEAEMPDEDVLRQVEKWFVDKKQMDEKIRQEKANIRDVEIQLTNLRNKVIDLINDDLLLLLGEGADQLEVKAIIALVEKKQGEIDESLKLLHDEKVHLIRKGSLEDVAANLVEGDPCPVCGSTHHPEMLSISNLKEQLAGNEKRKDKLSQSATLLAKAYTSLTLVESRISDRKKLIKEANEKALQFSNNLEQHHNNFIWKGYHPTGQQLVQDNIEKSSQIKKELKKLRNEVGELDAKIKANEKEVIKAKDLLNELQLEKQSKDAKLETLKQQLEHLDIAVYKSKSEDDLDQEMKDINRVITQTETNHHLLKEAIEKIKSQLDTSRGSYKSIKNHHKEAEQSLVGIVERIDKKLQESPFAELSEIVLILREAIDMEEERQAIDHYKRDLNTVESKITDLKNAINGKEFDLEAYEKLNQAIEELIAEIETRKVNLTKLQQSIEKRKEDLQKRSELLEIVSKLETRAENLSTLQRLFRSSGFVNYVSSVYLQNLCNAANERFHKLSRQKLSLEMAEDNNFQVRDYLNEGKVRNVKTLSGGQTFQAALSLALALAESVQKENETDQNFFFLDEGFGSQDKESLQIVFDTLKSLRKENRVVGIISHVEDLKQEIDVYLDITNNEVQGSIIKVSWK